MKPVEAAQLVAMIALTYSTPAWADETLRIWQRMLGDLDVATATAVVEEWVRTRDERPSIAAIRRGVAERQFVSRDGTKLFLQPDEAWEFVDGCFRTVGQYREFPNTHPLVREAVDRMGWVSMCTSSNKDVLRGQFRHAYAPLLERSLAESAASEGAAAAPSAVAAALGHQTPQLEHDRPRLAGASRG